MQSIMIYKTKNEYKIITQSEVVGGFLLSTEPVVILSLDCADEELFDAIKHCIDSCKVGIPTPPKEELLALEKEILKLLEEKSYTSLNANTQSCTVEISSDLDAMIMPERYYKKSRPSQGLGHVDGAEVFVEDYLNNSDEFLNELTSLLNTKFR
jgi:hypothetical protein